MKALWLLSVAASVAAGAEEMTPEQAKCVLDGRRAVFLGDSVMRYCFFALNAFVETGEPRTAEFDDDSWGFGEGSTDYDTRDTWTEWDRYGDKESHRQKLRKDLDGSTTEFYFLSNVWIGEEDTDGAKAVGDIDVDADIVVYNGGLWFLLDDEDYMGRDESYNCGEDFDDRCEREYERMVTKAVENVLARGDGARIWRTVACCGKSSSASESADWKPAINDMNAIAVDVMAQNGMRDQVVDIHPTYDVESVDDATFDGLHPTVEMCGVWNGLMMREADRQLGTGCFGSPTYAPTYGPTYSPTADPTREPTTEPSLSPTREPSLSPTTREPTSQPTFAPSRPPTAAGVAPSSQPSSRPTEDEATQAPSTRPSHAPTIATARPSSLAPGAETAVPTMAPTSLLPSTVTVRFSLVGVSLEDISKASFQSSLKAAVASVLGVDVTSIAFLRSRRRRLAEGVGVELLVETRESTSELQRRLVGAVEDGSFGSALQAEATTSDAEVAARTTIAAETIAVTQTPAGKKKKSSSKSFTSRTSSLRRRAQRRPFYAGATLLVLIGFCLGLCSCACRKLRFSRENTESEDTADIIDTWRCSSPKIESSPRKADLLYNSSRSPSTASLNEVDYSQVKPGKTERSLSFEEADDLVSADI